MLSGHKQDGLSLIKNPWVHCDVIYTFVFVARYSQTLSFVLSYDSFAKTDVSRPALVKLIVIKSISEHTHTPGAFGELVYHFDGCHGYKQLFET